MRLFSNKETEVCGFLDKKGKFFPEKKDRDASNYKIEADEIDKQLERFYKEYFRKFNHLFGEREIRRMLDFLDANKSWLDFMTPYLETRIRKNELKIKYGIK